MIFNFFFLYNGATRVEPMFCNMQFDSFSWGVWFMRKNWLMISVSFSLFGCCNIVFFIFYFWKFNELSVV